jgi:hypothetical protein
LNFCEPYKYLQTAALDPLLCRLADEKMKNGAKMVLSRVLQVKPGHHKAKGEQNDVGLQFKT